MNAFANIELPWPHPALSPNFRSGTHWPRTKAVRRARKDAFYAMMAGKPGKPLPEGLIAVSLSFHPDCQRDRDMDNLIASMKPALDGIADALGVNDTRFRLSASIWPPASRARVVVVIG